VLNRTEQARKATSALNSLLLNKTFSGKYKGTNILYSDSTHINLQFGNFDTGLKVK